MGGTGRGRVSPGGSRRAAYPKLAHVMDRREGGGRYFIGGWPDIEGSIPVVRPLALNCLTSEYNPGSPLSPDGSISPPIGPGCRGVQSGPHSTADPPTISAACKSRAIERVGEKCRDKIVNTTFGVRAGSINAAGAVDKC